MVTSAADEHLSEAKDKLRDALQHLSSIVVDRCNGYDDFSEDYRDTIRESFAKLIAIRDELGS